MSRELRHCQQGRSLSLPGQTLAGLGKRCHWAPVREHVLKMLSLGIFKRLHVTLQKALRGHEDIRLNCTHKFAARRSYHVSAGALQL